jgi:hypothetical protein
MKSEPVPAYVAPGPLIRRALVLGEQERAEVFGCRVLDAVGHIVIAEERRQ